MATAFPTIDADGHILENPDEIRRYMDAPWKHRPTQLSPRNNNPWDTDLVGKIEPTNGYDRGLPAKRQVEIWNRILDDHEIEQAVLFPTGSGHIGKLQELDFAAAVGRAS